NAEMKHNMSAFDRADRSVEKYQTSLKGLNKKLKVQRKVTIESYKEWQRLAKQHGRNSRKAERARKEYHKQAAEMKNLNRYIGKTKNELKELERQQKIANSRWTKMGNKMEGFGGTMAGVGRSMSGFGRKMSMRVTAPLVGVAGAAIKLKV